jgi:hypothetical protein
MEGLSPSISIIASRPHNPPASLFSTKIFVTHRLTNHGFKCFAGDMLLHVLINPDARPIDERTSLRALIRCLRSIAAKYQTKEIPSMSPQPYDPKTHESASDAAARCAHSLSWLYAKMKIGTVRGVKIGGRWFVLRADIDALLRGQPQPETAA